MSQKDPTEPEYPRSPYPSLTKYFESAEQTIASAALLTLAHGLGQTPIILIFELICKIAEDGYSVGDIVPYSMTNHMDATSDDKGMAVIKDATNVRVRFGSAVPCLKLMQFDTGNGSNITNANWKLVVKGYC